MFSSIRPLRNSYRTWMPYFIASSAITGLCNTKFNIYISVMVNIIRHSPLQTHLPSYSLTYSQSRPNQVHIQLLTATLFLSQATWSLCSYRTTKIGTSSTIETKSVCGAFVILVPHDHIEFQRSSKVKFALNAVANMKPAKQKREEFHFKNLLHFQHIHYISVKTFVLYLLRRHVSLVLCIINNFD